MKKIVPALLLLSLITISPAYAASDGSDVLTLSTPTGFEETDLKGVQAKADAGNSNAMVELGTRYKYGWSGVAKDLGKSYQWYLKAAQKDNAQGQYNAGNALTAGNGVSADKCQALSWFEKAVEKKTRRRAGAVGYDVSQGGMCATG